MAENENRQRALEDALKKIEKSYGKGAVMKLGEKVDTQIQTVSSGSLALDIALGVGGFPRGRIIEVYGPESSGKTTVALHAVAEVQKRGGVAAFIDAEHALDPEYAKALGVKIDELLLSQGPESSGKTTVALHAVAEVQKRGGVAAFIDAEHALDPEYAKALGVNIDELLLSQPDTGEQGLGIADALVSSGAVDIVIVDSVAALVPRAEIDGDMGQSHVGLQARLMSQALRKLSGSINKTKTIAIFINQIREKVGVMFGNPETTPGGRALKFYATVRLEVRRADQIKQGTEILGNQTKIKVVKNKVAPPFKTAVVDIMYGEGISQLGELLDMAADLDFVKKSGAWYAYNDEKIGQGRENAKAYLADHPEVVADLNQKVRAHYGIGVAAPVSRSRCRLEPKSSCSLRHWGFCSSRSGRRRTNKFIRLIIRKNRALQFGSFFMQSLLTA